MNARTNLWNRLASVKSRYNDAKPNIVKPDTLCNEIIDLLIKRLEEKGHAFVYFAEGHEGVSEFWKRGYRRVILKNSKNVEYSVGRAMSNESNYAIFDLAVEVLKPKDI